MIGLALALLLAAGDTPPAATPPANPPPVDQQTDGDKVVCKSVEVTGSRFGRQECHTKREWAEITRNARDFVNQQTSGACARTNCN